MKSKAKTKILVVDDDTKLVRELTAHLRDQGYVVDSAEDGAGAVKLARSMAPDLVVLDITLSQGPISTKKTIDGIEVLRQLREFGSVPVLMLSVTSIPSVKVMALNIGADDYITKPFDLQELDARVEAILRRAQNEQADAEVLTYQRLTLDSGERRVWKDDLPIELTSLEFDILYSLARRPRHVFSRERLLDIAWKEPSYSIAKAVDVHIGHIRQKIEDDPNHPTLVVTVRGIGYKFEDEPA
ncbi:MAG: response regulator [Candidatus Hydrogenedentota bacterium]